MVRTGSSSNLAVWWEECVPYDPAMEQKYYIEGRKNGDITRNEYRAQINLAPLEAAEERNKLLDTVGGMTGTMQVIDRLGEGKITTETAAKLLAKFLEIPIEEMNEIIGVGKESVPAVIEQLQVAVEQMKKPVRVEVDDGVVQKAADGIVGIASASRGIDVETE